MTSNRKQPLASIFSSFTGNGGASTSSTKRGDGEESVLPMMISGSSNAGGKGSLNQSGDRIALVMAGMAASTSLYVMNQTLISTSLGSHDQTTHGSNEEEEVTEQKEPQFNPIMVSIVLAALTSVFQLLISHVLLSLRRKSKDDSYSGINRRYVQEARLTLWQGIKQYDQIPLSICHAVATVFLIYLPHTMGIFPFMLLVGLDGLFAKLIESRGVIVFQIRTALLVAAVLVPLVYDSDGTPVPFQVANTEGKYESVQPVSSRSAVIFSACIRILSLMESSTVVANFFKCVSIVLLGYGETRLRTVPGNRGEDQTKSARGTVAIGSRISTFQACVLLLLTSAGYCMKTPSALSSLLTYSSVSSALILAFFYICLKDKVFTNIGRRIGSTDLRIWFYIPAASAALISSLLFERITMIKIVGGATSVGSYWILQRHMAALRTPSGQVAAEWEGTSNALEGGNFTVRLRRLLKHVMSDSNSRKILYFLSINLAFMFVEIFVGLLTNSLGLVSDAGHMFFDNASLFIGLYAAYMSKWKSDEVYTYGYSRYETLAGFANGVFLVFIAVSVVIEGLERLREPPEIRSDHLLLVSFLGLLVNLVGLAFFHEHSHGHSHDHGHSHGGHGHSHEHGHGHTHTNGTDDHEDVAGTDKQHAHTSVAYEGESAHNENMHGVFLHVLADTLGSAGVIVSSLLIELYEWYWADAVASLLIAVLILLSVLPFLQATATALLLRTPTSLLPRFRKALMSIGKLPEVHRIEDAHCWQYDSTTPVATVNVLVGKGISIETMTKTVKDIIQNECNIEKVTVQVSHVGG
eukprot:gb/GECG01002914.1/.p1 GENE.gb/GECG01002914.1/~~gb/GECG01002914.1/.p1  ORF type:complete len:808 (+),score=58.68 gb/GECG01002914.1/:1-2424(+)